jgi:hypothetical protein
MKSVFRAATVIFAIIGLAFTAVFFGMRLELFNVRGSIGERNRFFTEATMKTAASVAPAACASTRKACAWNETPEWLVVEGGLRKDAALIARVSAETGISSRMIASVVVPEQTRFFTAERDVFKRYFEPLKILGSLTQFSLGVSGIKQETANNIEKYANDPTSEFYPGEAIAALLAYAPGADHDAELYARLTDSKNHYYQYLYTAAYIREIQAQWQSAGYDISTTPEAVVTLFNIGFAHSHPKADPAAGGATIMTGGTRYTYGELGALFYRSSELADIFPEE